MDKIIRVRKLKLQSGRSPKVVSTLGKLVVVCTHKAKGPASTI